MMIINGDVDSFAIVPNGAYFLIFSSCLEQIVFEDALEFDVSINYILIFMLPELPLAIVCSDSIHRRQVACFKCFI